MKPVDQSIEGARGDCWRACIASLLEVPIEAVPHFMLDADQVGLCWPDALAATRSWLGDRGYELRATRADAEDVEGDSIRLGYLTYCRPGFPRVRERYAIFAVETGALTETGAPRLHAVIGFVSLFPWDPNFVAHDPSRDLRGRVYHRVVDAFVLAEAS